MQMDLLFIKDGQAAFLCTYAHLAHHHEIWFDRHDQQINAMEYLLIRSVSEGLGYVLSQI